MRDLGLALLAIDGFAIVLVFGFAIFNAILGTDEQRDAWDRNHRDDLGPVSWREDRDEWMRPRQKQPR